jgi:N-acetylglucosaminyldiphosphoundecaprenol N-acetyl-beta-D-mannosaminyltransferase
MSSASDPVCKNLPERHDVLGVGVSAVSLTQTLDTLREWIQRGDRHYVCVTGVHGVVESHWDPELRSIHNQSGLTTPDGMPLLWILRAAGHAHATRVCGPELLPAVCAASTQLGWRHYFYGGDEGVAGRLTERLGRSFPGLNVAGSSTPPFPCPTDVEDSEAVAAINQARPDIVWIGLSTPKQERWMAQNRPHIDAPILIGVGAAFDIHAGLRERAPIWMQRAGLEWLFRTSQEPGRLVPRYLRVNSTFVALIAAQAVRSWVTGGRGARVSRARSSQKNESPTTLIEPTGIQ